MSDKNKQIVKEINTTLLNGDTETFLSHCAEDATWNIVGEKENRGKAAIRQFMDGMKGFEPPKFTVDRIVADGPAVVCYGDMTMKGEDSIEGKYSYCDFYEFVGDKVSSLRSFVVKHKTEADKLKEKQATA